MDTCISANRTQRRSARSGFTLIELLTVIAIIGILASILIPVVGKVRESAHRTQCGSNLRQIAMASLAYESENGALPGTRLLSNRYGVRRMVYSPDNPANNYPDAHCISFVIGDYLDTPYGEADPGPFFCQSNLDERRQDPRWPVYILMRNILTVPRSFFGDPDFNRYPVSLEQIERASNGPKGRNATELSQIWMIGDIDSGNYASTGGAASIDIPPPHDDGRNYAFFDGHLEYRKSDNWPAHPSDASSPFY